MECQFPVWSKVKVTGRQKLPEIAAYIAYVFTYGRQRRRLRRRLQTRPNPRSATGRTAAYHVGTRCRHILWLKSKIPFPSRRLISNAVCTFLIDRVFVLRCRQLTHYSLFVKMMMSMTSSVPPLLTLMLLLDHICGWYIYLVRAGCSICTRG